MMSPIEVPVANLPIKIVMGCACVLIVFAVLWWGVPKFMVYLRIVSGRKPRKPGTRTIHMVLGLLAYLIIFAPAMLAGAMLIELVTTPPSVVSAGGVAAGGGLLLSRKTIAWGEVKRVDCVLRHDGMVTKLIINGATKRIELAGGGDLSGVRDVIWSHVPEQAVRPCMVPLRSNL
jgi:hypothetical protein